MICINIASRSFVKWEMRRTEKDIWKGFYANDCLCDIKYTAEVLKHLRFYIRNMGDGPHFFEWQRKYLYKEVDRRGMQLTNMENHRTDEELYEAMSYRDVLFDTGS